jgi:predicted Rossmann fold nucleotide-binding protein DprA/Smf involved in DNA uptake
MPPRSQDALATLLLTNHILDLDVPPFGPKEFWRLTAAVGSPSALLGVSEDDLADGDPIVAGAAGRITRLLDASTRLAFELERLESQGFLALTSFDDAYPRRVRDRLGEHAPPVVFVVGPVELLATDAIGLVGSRNVDDAGARAARDAAAAIAGDGITLVSGGAKGVDELSMTAARDHGGPVVGYLADSLERRVKVPVTRRAVAEGAVCLVTMFRPSAGFSVENAMARNKLIYASSLATLVIASDLGSGGTWAGATEALKQGYGRVLVWRGQGQGPGNEGVIEQGGTAVTSATEVVRLARDAGRTERRRQQLSLEI